jgi:hypothetical protein
MGQEVPITGYSDLMSVAGTTNWSSTVANLTDVNGAAVTSAPTNATYTSRRMVQMCAGYQTPKASQPALECWIPLIFWLN